MSARPAKGDLLISEPFLPDPNFERSVILLCEHNEEGTLGFVLNKPTEYQLSDVIEEVGSYEKKLYNGGPVQMNTLHFIHRSAQAISDSAPLGNGMLWGGNFEELLSLINTRQLAPEDVRFFVGYSGWGPGQLEDELKENSWFVYKQANAQDVFDRSANDLWRKGLRDMGGKYRMFSNYPTDPRLN